MLVTIALISTLAIIAIPGFISWLPDYRLRSAAQDLLSNFQKAKLTAVKRNINTVVCFTSSGYSVFLDPNTNFINDGTPDEVVITTVNWSDYKSLTVTYPGDFSFVNNADSPPQPCIGFRPTAIPVDAAAAATATGNAALTNTNNKNSTVFVSAAGSVYIQ
jgi:type II secretory pathway pseudopilin PulG